MTRWLSRITLFLLIALSLLLSIAACAEDETVYWINPDGGRYYHLDQNCPSIHPRYLLQMSSTFLHEGMRTLFWIIGTPTESVLEPKGCPVIAWSNPFMRF